jgi:hypothetical protein
MWPFSRPKRRKLYGAAARNKKRTERKKAVKRLRNVGVAYGAAEVTTRAFGYGARWGAKKQYEHMKGQMEEGHKAAYQHGYNSAAKGAMEFAKSAYQRGYTHGFMQGSAPRIGKGGTAIFEGTYRRGR